MGRCVIRQPDGLYAVFSSGTDRWVAWDLTREQYIERRVQEAAREARADAARLLDDTDAGLVCAGWTFAEANAQSQWHGGEVLDGPIDVGLIKEFRAQDAEAAEMAAALEHDPALGGKLHDVHGGPGQDCWCGYVGHDPPAGGGQP